MAQLTPRTGALRPSHVERYDVVVVGGGSAGVAAAVGAARTGARTLLLESYGFLGGAATRSLVLAWCGVLPQQPPPKPAPVVGGVLDRVLLHLRELGIGDTAYYSGTGNWPMPLNPEATKLALDRTVAEAHVDVRLHSLVVAATRCGARIESLQYADPAGLHEIQASAFVDASGDAALATFAAASACPLHDPQHAGQPASYPVRLSGVSSEHAFDKARRAAALATIETKLGTAALRRDGGILTPIPGTDDVWWLAIEADTQGLDARDLSAAEQDGRALAWIGVDALRRHVPGFEHANISATGPKIGIRETRHVATRDPLREQALLDGMRRPDGIARGCWPMEIHHAPGRVEYRSIGGDGSYDIQLGALQSSDLDNLWLPGRNIGADSAAYASARVMGTCFATGHAAGVGAAMAGAAVSDIRSQLLAQGAML